MDQLRPFGRRDIFGILLPGTIPIFVGVYLIWGIFGIFGVSIKNILEQEFLVTVIMFVTAYLVGSLLRLFAADNVDKKSSQYLLKTWKKEHDGLVPSEYQDKMEELLQGDDVSGMPIDFDAWLWTSDVFPYVAWQNRFWYTNGFSDVIEFYRNNHKDSLWSKHESSPKTFFNYCKLVIIEGGGTLADEINMAEGLTRFFAGTYSALKISALMVIVSIAIQSLIVADWLVNLGVLNKVFASANMNFLFAHILVSAIFLFLIWWMQKLIVKKFRRIRLKESETVFYAFYLNQKGKAQN